MGNSIVASRGLLAKVVAGTAIALFWCVSAISTVGVASLATAVSAVTSPASAGDKDRRHRDGNRNRHRRERRRRRRGNSWEWYWWGALGVLKPSSGLSSRKNRGRQLRSALLFFTLEERERPIARFLFEFD